MAFTFFFRDLAPLELAVRHLIQTATGCSNIRVWDAGSAMGQEPYTLAILLAENMGKFAFRNVRIFASDYDAPLLDILTKAVYPYPELERIPREYFEKYFEPADAPNHFRVSDLIRESVNATVHNLLSYKPIRHGFKLIVCKNVLLHFQYEERLEVIKMFHQALDPDGLFISEHTQKMPPELNHLFKQVCPEGQLYRKVA